MKEKCIVMLCLLCTLIPIYAQKIQAYSVVESKNVTFGEYFLFQIQIHGTNDTLAPDTANIQDFYVQSLGGRTNNSESYTSINGRVTHTIKKVYIYSYRLTPKKRGKLLIPSLKVHAEGKDYYTNTLNIYVGKSEKSEYFHLVQNLDKKECFVGEPVVFTFSWYIGKKPHNIHINVPVLENKNFEQENVGKSQKLFEIGSQKVIIDELREEFKNKLYTVVRFKRALIPLKSGILKIAPSAVSCQVLTGYKRKRGFDSFFDDDFFKTGVYKKQVTTSEALLLHVKELPTENQPENFQGYIGAYTLSISASTTEVNIGDPIILKIAIEGSEYLKNIECPDLRKQKAFKDFKISSENTPGKIENGKVIFEKTIRARHAQIKKIPPVELHYFDSKKKQYSIAKSNAIPLIVKQTKIITSKDARGYKKIGSTKNEITSVNEGIAHNYEDLSVLENQKFGLLTLLEDTKLIVLFLFPFGAYLSLLFFSLYKNKINSNPQLVKKKQAYGNFIKNIKQLHTKEDFYNNLLVYIREYISDKLQLCSVSITYNEAKQYLEKYKVPEEVLQDLKKIFDQCEAAQYGGGSFAGQDNEAIEIIKNTITTLDKKIG